MAAGADRGRPARRQRGAAAVFTAIALVAGLSAAFLAIDLGRLYYTQRDLQRMANMAALDAARVAGGCLGIPDNPSDAAHTEAVRSVVANQGESAYVMPGNVQVGRRLTGPDGKRYFDPIEDSTLKNRAVQVRLERQAPMRLFPLARDDGSRRLAAIAAAYSRPQATLEVGSKLAEVNPELLNDVLSGLLGGPVRIQTAGYRALFDASVPITEVLEEVTVGTPEELFTTPIPVPDLLNAIANILAQQGNAAAAAAAAAIAAAVNTVATVTPEQLVGIEEPASQALVGAGTLIMSAAQQANASIADGTNLIDFPVDFPSPFDDGGVEVRIIEATRQSILSPGQTVGGGDGYARNAQALIQATLPFSVAGIGKVDLPLWVQGAEATAQVLDIRCARRGVPNDTVFVGARSSIARIGIGRFDDITLPNPQPRPAELVELNLRVLGATYPVKVMGYAWAPVGREDNVELDPYVDPFPKVQTLGTPPVSAIADAVLEMGSRLQLTLVLPRGLPPVTTDALMAVAQPLLDTALRPALVDALTMGGDDVVSDLSNALGLYIGGADITVRSVVADEPVLFTR